MVHSTIPYPERDDGPEDLYRRFFVTEADAYLAAAEAAAERYAAARLSAARRFHALAEGGYATLQGYLLDALSAKLLHPDHRFDLERKMRTLQGALARLDMFMDEPVCGSLSMNSIS